MIGDAVDAIAAYQAQDFGTFQDLIGLQARADPAATAIICDDARITYRDLDDLADRVAAGLQRGGVAPRATVAICAASSIGYVAVFIGTLRAGAAISPLSPASTPEQLSAMVADSGATHLFTDRAVSAQLASVDIAAHRVALDDGAAGTLLAEWLPPAGETPTPVAIDPEQGFNIIYSSGTTGTPKGIVQPYAMRWNHTGRWGGFGPNSVTMISTGLYSNTTLVTFLPALATGGTVVLMPKFDAGSWRCRSGIAPITRCWCRCSTAASSTCPTSTRSTCRVT